MHPTFSIDDLGPLPIERPASPDDLRAMVREAAASDRALYPLGGCTMMEWGQPPTKHGTAIDLRGFDRVIDYPARDMTITVQAGITIAQLRETLKNEGQQLPVDIPRPERATLGGAIATNTSGPRRFGYGTIREHLIGMKVALADGRVIKSGGKVVKNVAGYDLAKLFIGARGSLGTGRKIRLRGTCCQCAMLWRQCQEAFRVREATHG